MTTNIHSDDVTALPIDVWTDFACPACYLVKPRLDAAVTATGRSAEIVVRYHAWQLFPEATDTPFDSLDHVVHKFGGDEARARQLEQRMSDLATAQHQPYRIHHPIATSITAHRMLKLAAEYRLDSVFIDRLQRDLFGDGTDVYHADYLRPTSIGLGMPADRVEAALTSDLFGDEVRADQTRARRLGLTGIPFIVFADSTAIVGAVGVDDLRRAIATALDEKDGVR